MICARRKLEEGGFPGLTLEDLPQIVRDGCAPSQDLPSRTFNHFNHFSHFAVSSFFDQCTGGEILVNCRRSEYDRSVRLQHK